MKRVKLEYSNSTDKNIIGIVCQKPDYWLALQLNKKLTIRLDRQEDIPIYKERLQSSILFHFFSFINHWGQGIFLLKNYTPFSTLFSKYKNFDYFILLDDSIPIQEYLLQIRNIQNIDAALTFPLSSIPKIEYFLEDLELHILEINKGL